MSKHEKLLAKLKATPPPSDLRWEELVSVLEHLGYKGSCNGGSHHRFVHQTSLDVINVPKPHPDNFVRRHYLRQIAEKLNNQGIV